MNNVETWKPVVGFEGLYEVSDQGRVRSLDRQVLYNNGRFVDLKGKLLKTQIDRKGYGYVRLCNSGADKACKVHTLALAAFVGPRPNGCESCHNNNDPGDNRLTNLRYGTKKENNGDKVRHGTHSKGSRNVKAILNETDIPVIRQLARTESQISLARKYGVDASAINHVTSGRTWRHV